MWPMELMSLMMKLGILVYISCCSIPAQTCKLWPHYCVCTCAQCTYIFVNFGNNESYFVSLVFNFPSFNRCKITFQSSSGVQYILAWISKLFYLLLNICPKFYKLASSPHISFAKITWVPNFWNVYERFSYFLEILYQLLTLSNISNIVTAS